MKPFQIALACVTVAAAIYACTPLPDIEDDEPIINGISPIPLDQIDAAGCAVDALPPEVCARLNK